MQKTDFHLQRTQDRSEDVHLDGLLPWRFGLADALDEVLQHLVAMLVGHAGEDNSVQLHRAVDDRHTQRERARDGVALEHSENGNEYTLLEHSENGN